MAKKKRDIGAEILEGIREIKRGEHGRVINVPRAPPKSRVVLDPAGHQDGLTNLVRADRDEDDPAL